MSERLCHFIRLWAVARCRGVGWLPSARTTRALQARTSLIHEPAIPLDRSKLRIGALSRAVGPRSLQSVQRRAAQWGIRRSKCNDGQKISGIARNVSSLPLTASPAVCPSASPAIPSQRLYPAASPIPRLYPRKFSGRAAKSFASPGNRPH
jgi:hypothetical protein